MRPILPALFDGRILLFWIGLLMNRARLIAGSMRLESADPAVAKGWYAGPWNVDRAVAVGWASAGIDAPHEHARMTEIYLVIHPPALPDGEAHADHLAVPRARLGLS